MTQSAEKDRLANLCCGHAACQREVRDAVDRFTTDAMNRGIIPMHVAADLSQYLVEEWSATDVLPPAKGDDA